MKQFTMSMYKNKEGLYKDKAEYYEKLFKLCANRLILDGVLCESEGDYCCAEDGLTLDDHLKYGDSL